MVTHSYTLLIKSKDILARRWFWIFWYFERNVPLQLPRHYSLPLPRFNILTKSFFSSLVSTSSQFPTSSPSNVIKGWKEMAVEQNPAVQVILITKHKSFRGERNVSGVARERNSHWRRRKKLNRKTPAYLKLTYLLTVAYLGKHKKPCSSFHEK